MKTIFVIPNTPPAKAPEPRNTSPQEKERRQNQRRMAVPRRVQDGRRAGRTGAVPTGRRNTNERRDSGDRRRLPDRRLGLKIDLDLSEFDYME